MTNGHERRTAAFAMLLMLAQPGTCAATPNGGAYVAQSNTAISITGDIELSPLHLRMAHGNVLYLKLVTMAGRFATDQGDAPARVFRVTRPANPVLLNNNRLCSTAVRWIVTWQMPHRGLGLAAFSGSKPRSENSPGLCGTFYYGAR